MFNEKKLLTTNSNKRKYVFKNSKGIESLTTILMNPDNNTVDFQVGTDRLTSDEIIQQVEYVLQETDLQRISYTSYLFRIHFIAPDDSPDSEVFLKAKHFFKDKYPAVELLNKIAVNKQKERGTTV